MKMSGGQVSAKLGCITPYSERPSPKFYAADEGRPTSLTPAQTRSHPRFRPGGCPRILHPGTTSQASRLRSCAWARRVQPEWMMERRRRKWSSRRKVRARGRARSRRRRRPRREARRAGLRGGRGGAICLPRGRPRPRLGARVAGGHLEAQRRHAVLEHLLTRVYNTPASSTTVSVVSFFASSLTLPFYLHSRPRASLLASSEWLSCACDLSSWRVL